MVFRAIKGPDLVSQPQGGGVTSAFGIAAGAGLAGGGALTQTVTISMASSGVAAGTYGNATSVPQVTFNARGQATTVTAVPISFPGGSTPSTANIGLSVSNQFLVSGSPAIGTGTITLAMQTSTVSAGSYGNSTAVAQLSVNAQGQVISASSVPISFPAGGGGASMMSVAFVADGAVLALTNMALALQFLANSHRFATKADLTNFTQVRLIVNKQATAGAANSKIILRYIGAFNTTASNWLDIGASEVSVAINVQNTVLVTQWINLAALAKADVFVCPLMSGGDGALDPAVGHIEAQFK